MLVDISKITLDNIHLYSLIGNVRKGQHLTNEEKEFFNNLINSNLKLQERNIQKRSFIVRTKLSEEEGIQHIKDYQHEYYLKVTKIKRKQKRDLAKEKKC